MSMEVADDPHNPYKENKDVLLRQYMLWNSSDMVKTNLPPFDLSGVANHVPQSAKTPESRERVGVINFSLYPNDGFTLYNFTQMFTQFEPLNEK